MKQLKLIFIIFLSIIVILFLGLFIFLKTLDINRFKGQITQQISKSINREVSIESISFEPSIKQGVTIHISELVINDHPSFSLDPMLTIDSAYLNIDALSLIFKRQIFVSNIEFDAPKINLIRNDAGEFNVQKFIEQVKDQKKETKDSASKRPEGIVQESTSPKESDIAFGDLLIRSIRINDGTIIFNDRSLTPPVTIPVTGLDLQISNMSFDAAVPFHADASLWSRKKNIRVHGLIRINAQNQQVRIDDLKVHTDLSDLSLDRIIADVPSFKSAGFKEGLAGKLMINISQMILGEAGLLVLSSEVQLTEGRIQLKDFPVPMEHINMRFEVSESDLNVTEIKLPFANGELVATGLISEYLKEQKFIGSLDIKDIQLSELTKYFDLPIAVDGVINGSFKGSGKGLSNAALKEFLTGDGALEMIDGRIIDINLLKLVLSKLSFIPNLVDRIKANLPEKYKEMLNRKGTILSDMKIDTRIHNGMLMIDRAEVNAEGFLITARGQLDFDQNLNLEADFYVANDLSASMVAASEELSYLLDERQQIHVPFKPYNGKMAHFVMYPDVGNLSAEILRNRGREELKKIISKVLDLGEAPTSVPSEGQEVNPQEREVSPEEAIIESILDMIPIFQ